MRLTNQEQQQIHQAIASVIQKPFEVRLYGSRADDTLTGGDIDLLLVVANDLLATYQQLKPELLVALKDKLGDQRIDLTICSKESIANNTFLSMIYPKSLLIS